MADNTNLPKLKMPPEFTGDRGEAKAWLQKCSLYFTFNATQFNTDEKKNRRLVHLPMGRFGEAIEVARGALFRKLFPPRMSVHCLMVAHK